MMVVEMFFPACNHVEPTQSLVSLGMWFTASEVLKPSLTDSTPLIMRDSKSCSHDSLDPKLTETTGGEFGVYRAFMRLLYR